MWKVTLKGLLAHKLRLALTAIAIVLGVTFISGTFVLTDTLHNTFTTLFGNVYQNIDFQVRGVAQFSDNGAGAVRNPIPESFLPAVRRVPGVEAAAGSVQGYAQFVAPDGKAISSGGAPTLGLSLRPGPARSPSCTSSRAGRPPTPTTWSWTRPRPRNTTSEIGGAGPGPAAGTVRGPSPSPASPVRHSRQPGRSDAGRLHCTDRAGRPRTRWASSTPSTS